MSKIDMTYAINKFNKENNQNSRETIINVYENLGLAVVGYDGQDFLEYIGCIDQYGNIAIPREYNIKMSYSEGLFATYNKSLSGGFIDVKGNIVIPFKYTCVYEFNEELAAVSNQSRKFGFIDKNGKTIIPFVYENASYFLDGKALVKSQNKGWHYIDKAGHIINSNSLVTYTDNDHYTFRTKAFQRISEINKGEIKEELDYRTLKPNDEMLNNLKNRLSKEQGLSSAEEEELLSAINQEMKAKNRK